VGVSPPKIDRDLQTIENEYRNGCDMKQVETRCLELIKAYPAKEDQGKIYAKIPWLYNAQMANFDQAKRGTLSRETVISYCMLALDCKPDPVTTAQTYAFWGSSAGAAMPMPGTEEYSTARLKAAKPYLEGLQYLLEKGVPEELSSKAPEMAAPVDTTSIAAHQQQVAAHNQTQELVGYRKALTGALISIYSQPPFKTDELAKLAADIVRDKDVVSKMVAKVEENIQQSSK
jgi:hypothetical protein